MNSRRILSVGFAMAFLLLFWAGAVAADPAGEVTLPLKDYLSLLESIDEAAKAAAEAEREEAFGDLLSHHRHVRIEGDIAEITSRFEVEVRGAGSDPIALPFEGHPEQVTLEPAEGAALHRREDGSAVLAVSESGSYRVRLSGRRQLEEQDGFRVLPLAPSPAAVVSLEVDLLSSLGWLCDGAVLVSEEAGDSRRRLRLAPQRGQGHELRLYRELGTGSAEVFARAVVVTLAELGAEGFRRHDVVHYEVQRGELESFEVTLPATLDPQVVGTDEGETYPVVEAGVLNIPRQQRLSSDGYLFVSGGLEAEGLPLTPIRPKVEVRARYLVTLQAIAAEARPLPQDAWALVDLEDLPGALHASVRALKPTAVWRRLGREGEGAETLEILRHEDADRRELLIGRRETLTLLTVDGTLVHRETFELEGEASSLDVELPPGAALWSTSVDGVAVRPLERQGKRVVPLGLAGTEGATVEVVAVLERAIPEGRSSLEVTLPRVDVPVLDHSWQLLLPEKHKYRFSEGTLRPVDPGDELTGYGRPASRADRPALKRSGTASLEGKVVAEDGTALPGAIVVAWIRAYGGSRTVFTDEQGRYRLSGLPAGSYEVSSELPGFQTVLRYLEVTGTEARKADFELPLASVEETIVVSAESPGFRGNTGPTREELFRANEAQARNLYLNQAAQLQQGLVGGVKPLAVEIPESGKALLLAGALPPKEVSVALQVRRR